MKFYLRMPTRTQPPLLLVYKQHFSDMRPGKGQMLCSEGFIVELVLYK